MIKTGSGFLHFLKYIAGIDPPQTQTTLAEQQALATYAEGKNMVVEIGVFEGFTTEILARSMSPKGKLYGIDPFFKGKLGVCYGELICKHYLKKNRLLDRVVLIPKLSWEAVNDVKENIDFIFIDGDHSYEGLRRDWNDWSGKIIPGGCAALHDTQLSSNASTEKRMGSHIFFEDAISRDTRFDIVEQVDSLNILRRRAE